MSTQRKYWGWGYENQKIDAKALKKTISFLCQALNVENKIAQHPLPIEEVKLREPRFQLNETISKLCSYDRYDRLSHTYGKSTSDIVKGLRGEFPNPPDYVAFPKTEDDIQKLITFAEENTLSLIPYGGGSSVVGGIEPTKNIRYNGTVSVDMKHFDQLLEIDETSRCAKFQAGVYGPALDSALKPYNLTLRHFPQSYEFSTLGGWIATRAGGHYATLYTHIDDLVESVRIVTPKGISETRRLPGSGAGPSEERIVLGSEGIFGFITEAWVRLQDTPKYKTTTTLLFKKYDDAINATRKIAQSGLFPSNCRLVDPLESFSMGLGDGNSSVLLLGFESASCPVDDKLNQAISLCHEFSPKQIQNIGQNKDQQTSEDANSWKQSFLQAPYLRDELLQMHILAETFETAITWDKFEAFNKRLKSEVQKCIIDTCGSGFITCRFTHVYPDGPAPYYTVVAKTEAGKEIEQWQKIKDVACSIIIEMGATITHHHAVGKDHRPYYEQQRSPFLNDILSASKDRLDPKGILNPGVLISERDE